MSSRTDVIIAGGGMAGASLALALAQAGKSVAVIEPNTLIDFDTQQPFDLRVSAISPASRNLLQNLGVWQDITNMRINSFSKMLVEDGAGSNVLDFSATEINEPALGYIIENRLISLCLRAAAQAHPDISWYEDVVAGFSLEQEDAIVTLGEGKVLLAQLLVGADGASSFVRQHAEVELFETNYQQQAIVASIGVHSESAPQAWQRFEEQEVLAFLPLTTDTSSIVWSVAEEKAAQLLEKNEQDFLSELQKLTGNQFGQLRINSERKTFPLYGRHAAQYVQPRLALVGDAAHSVHPLAGQGANLGFMDVAELSRVISNSDRDLGSLHMLKKYQRKRLGENALMLRSLEAVQQLYNSDNPLVTRVRSIGTRLMSDFKPLKALLIQHASGTLPDAPDLLKPFQ